MSKLKKTRRRAAKQEADVHLTDDNLELDYGGFLFWPDYPISQPLSKLKSQRSTKTSNEPKSEEAGVKDLAYEANGDESTGDKERLGAPPNPALDPEKKKRQDGLSTSAKAKKAKLEAGVFRQVVHQRSQCVRNGKKNKAKKKWDPRRRIPDDLPPPLRKYWFRRYELFSKYDEGIRLDLESWYSVTPEKVALHIARKCATPNGVILDAFCGCGGNTIQFAKYCRKVIAIDIDPLKIEHAKHNAQIYGVIDKIQFMCGDFMELAPTLNADVVFLSPPWGGPGYQGHIVFDLESMIPMDGFKVFDAARGISPNVAYFLPRNVHRDQLDELASTRSIARIEIEENDYCNILKAKTIYFGELCGRTVAKCHKRNEEPDA